MTHEQGFRLVTRALTIYALFWVVDEILISPSVVIGLFHHLRLLRMAHDMDRFVGEETYWVRYYALHTCEQVMKIGLSLWLAMWFYRGGPRVRKFFRMDSDPVTVE